MNDRDTEGHTPLFRLASRRSRVATQEEQIATAARLLLDRGANLPRSARGTTALIEAVQNRHHAMAAVLIDSGQRLDSANSYGDNALHNLCRRAADTAREIAGKERFIASFGERWVSEKQQREAREELEELRAEQMRCYATAALLLHSGQIDPDEKNSAGRRPFDLAMEGGAQWVGALLSGGDPFDELTMENGGMSLFQTLRKKDRKALEALLQAGVDLNAECDDRGMSDWTGKTPLACALEWGETEIAAMLLRAGADPDRRTSKGVAPFAVWIGQGCRVSDGMERFAPLMELFEERGWHPDAPQTGKDERALMLVCQHDDYELAIWTLRRLLKQKVEVNARDALGRTALMHLLGPHSAGPYQPEMLERLLEVGADPCTADNEGRTVLHYAAEGYTHAAARQAAELLLDFGRPDVSAVDVVGRGRTIRHDARFPRGTNVDFVEELGEGHLRVRTYERGVENETLACGTGVTAAAIVTSYVRQPAVHRFRIEVPGGELEVRFRHEAGTQHYTDIRLTGPARRVFEGEFDTENF